METFLADGFRNVDSVSDAKKILRCLSFINDLPDYKELSIDTLNLCKNSLVADLACGLGFDLLRLHRRASNGYVVGFDISTELVVAARQYTSGHDNVEVIQSDALHLEAADQYFDRFNILSHLLMLFRKWDIS